MKRLRLLLLILIFSATIATAQSNKIVFGPLEGDDAGMITVTNGQPYAELECWVRTDPDNPAQVYGVVHALMSEDEVILDLGGFFWDDYYEPPNWGQAYYDRYVHNPDDAFPIPEGHTAVVTGGIYDVPQGLGFPLDTQGEWDYYGSFWMHINTGLEEDALYQPFSRGWYPFSNQSTNWAFEAPPGGSVVPEQSYADVWITSNTAPEFTLCPQSGCAEAGMTICFEIAGSDFDILDDLHIVQIGGPGEYTEETGGEGGLTTGRWCWENPEVGEHTVTFELDDGSGGSATCEFTIEVSAITFEIDCVAGFPGVTVVVPVRLHTCAFETGGVEFLAQWDPTALEFLTVEPASRIDFGNEYFYWNADDPCDPPCDPGGAVRVTWISDMSNGVPHAPAGPGSEPVFNLIFDVDDALPWGMEIAIEFLNQHYSDNTISDPSGYIWWEPVQINGCVEVQDAESFSGDPNMNGWFFEIGDAVLVARRLIHGPIVWTENGTDDDDLQEAAADLNGNGFADVGDLVRFINIINDEIPPPKVEPGDALAQISMPDVIGDNMEVTVEAGIDVGGVLVSIDHSGVELGAPVANSGMELLYHDADGVMNVVVYSMDANVIPAGSSILFTIPVLSDNGGSMSFAEVSSADSYGRLMETMASLRAPLPTAFAVEQNYPNPFNARTQIGVTLPEASDINVDIYGITGQLVESISGHYGAGNHSISWDASDVSSGIYFYRVQAGDYSETKRMVLLK